MFKNYFLVSLRNLLRNKVYSSISILGLVISIAASILIFSYVSYENNYDRFFQSYEDIYRVSLKKYRNNEESLHSALTYTALSAHLKENYPEVLSSTCVAREKCLMVFDNHKKFNDQEILWVDQSFIDVFSLNFINGSKENALKQANTAIISHKAAQRFFGNENPIGKTVLLNEGLPFLIVAEVETLPENSHMAFDFLLSLSTGYSMGWATEAGDWMYNWVYTYIRVSKPFDPNDFQNKLNQFARNNDLSQKADGVKNEYHLQALKNIYLDSALTGELKSNGNRKMVYAMGLISIFILIIAWINFINLCTATAIERAKETGIRKVSGAGKAQLISQYLFESILLNLFAGIIAFFLARTFLPYFSDLISKPLSEVVWTNTSFWMMYAGLFITGSLIFGIYPALVLSGFEPLEVLKSRATKTIQGNLFRKVLVVFQFTITIILVSATLVLYLQFEKMKTTASGLDYNQVLIIKAPRTLNLDPNRRITLNSFREQIIGYHNIREVSNSNPVPGQEITSHNEDIRQINQTENNHQTFSMLSVDNHFLSLYNIEILAGNNFSMKYEQDTNWVIINERAVKALGFENVVSAIDEKILINNIQKQIKAVAADYYQEGLKKQVSPTIFRHDFDYLFGYISVKLNTTELKESIAFLKEQWEISFPKDPFDYFFADDIFQSHYEKEQQASRIFAGFTVLALIIASLGLLGLISYMASKRTKEIGIRKVLGAPTKSLLILLLKDFSTLIGIAVFLGIPISYLIMDSWLANYPIRITLNLGIFLIPVLALVGSALLVTAYTLYKTVFSNPIEALRYE